MTTAAMTPSKGCREEARAGGVLAEAEALMGLQCQGELRRRSISQGRLPSPDKAERLKQAFTLATDPGTNRMSDIRQKKEGIVSETREAGDSTRMPQRYEDPFS